MRIERRLALWLAMVWIMTALFGGMGVEWTASLAETGEEIISEKVEEDVGEAEEAELPVEGEDTTGGSMLVADQEEPPAFPSGYALADEGARVWSDRSMTVPLGTLVWPCVVYVRGGVRAAEVLLCVHGELIEGYVAVEALLSLNEEEEALYLENVDAQAFVDDGDALPLGEAVFAPVQPEDTEPETAPKEETEVDYRAEEEYDEGPKTDFAPDMPETALADAGASYGGTASGVRIYTLNGRSAFAGGEAVRLYATLMPEDADIQAVRWQSSDLAVATVNSVGVATLKTTTERREVTITATAIESGARGQLTLNVYPAAESMTVNAKGIALPDAVFMQPGERLTLAGTIRPESALQGLDAGSDNPMCVRVERKDGETTLYAQSEGQANVTVTSADGRVSRTVSVQVQSRLTSLTLPDSFDIAKGKSVALEAQWQPTAAKGDCLEWKSDNARIVSVTPEGVVKGLKQGTATITATATDGSGLSASVRVNVKKPATKVVVRAEGATCVDLTSGKALKLSAAIAPATAGQAVRWSSSRPDIARVDALSGTVTGVAPGSAVITATAADGSGKSGTIRVNVVYPVKSIEIEGGAIVAQKGSVTLKARVFGGEQEPTLKDLVWTSGDRKVATVTAQGVVKGVKPGRTTITCAAADGCGAKQTFQIQVVKPVTRVTVQPAKLVFDMDDPASPRAQTLSATVTGELKTVVWSSSDEAVAVVDAESGEVIPVGAGSAKITATAADGSGKKAVATVTVSRTATGVAFETGKIEVGLRKTVKAAPVGLPAGGSLPALVFYSSDVKVATVSAAGVIKGVGLGEATITAALRDDPKKSASIRVVVRPTVTKVSVSAPSAYIEPGDPGNTLQLRAVVVPTTALSEVTWKSANPKIATVDENGLVTAQSGATGTVKITATARDGSGKSAAFTVKVQWHSNKIALDGVGSGGRLALAKGKSVAIGATILPEEASGVKLKWTSSNRKVASVTAKGVVKGVKPGTCVITCAAADGGAVATLNVTVCDAASSIEVTADGAAIGGALGLYWPGGSAALAARVLPATASAEVRWESDDVAVASVDERGRVTATGIGVCRVTATALDGTELSASVKVVVGRPAEDIRTAGLHAVSVGGETTLTALVSPEDAASDAVAWRSSDEKVAVVSEDGVVRGVREGRCVIYATAMGAPKGIRPECAFVMDVTRRVEKLDILCLDDVITGQNQELNLRWRDPTAQLTVSVAPAEANASVTWRSSDAKVVSVDENGVVTAHKVGTALLTATAMDGSGVSAQVTVKVISQALTVVVEGEYPALGHGKRQRLTARILPENRLNGEVVWSSSDENLCKVDADGIVTANAWGWTGKARITAATADASASAQYALDIIEPITALTLSAANMTLDLNGAETTGKLTCSVEPTGSAGYVRFVSDNPDAATVDGAGVVSAVESGDATVTVEALDGSGVSASCSVSVRRLVQRIDLSAGAARLYSGEQTVLLATLSPKRVDDDGVYWQSADERLAKVDQEGRVTVQDGFTGIRTVSIEARSADGNAAAVLELTVSTPAGAGFTWKDNAEGGLSLTGYTGDEKALRVPDVIGGKRVNVIAAGAFTGENCAAIEALTLPEGARIEEDALIGCVGLVKNGFLIVDDFLANYFGSDADVAVPEQVKRIGPGAFRDDASLETLRLPKGVTELGDNAFLNCAKLREITRY